MHSEVSKLPMSRAPAREPEGSRPPVWFALDDSRPAGVLRGPIAARIDRGKVQLLTRSRLDWTAKYPATGAALAKLPVKRSLYRRRTVWPHSRCN
jgi:hypothetical protein